MVVNQDLPELVGIEAYLNSGRQLKGLAVNKDQKQAYELLADCIDGIVMSEVFFCEERGVASLDAYTSIWDELYVNSCRRLSHPDPNDLWKNTLGCLDRSRHLFNRIHNVTIYKEHDNSYLILATFIDSYHEVSVRLETGTDGVVKQASAEFIRTPYKICKENICHMEKLVGLNIASMSKKEMVSIVGGSEGCLRIVDIISNCSQALKVVIQGATG